MQCLGLSKQYTMKGSEVNQFLKKIFGLSLLPPAEVRGCFAFGLSEEEKIYSYTGNQTPIPRSCSRYSGHSS
jgi:hypothetical protein